MTQIKGRSSAGTVHYGRMVDAPWLGAGQKLMAQACGMSRRQNHFIWAVGPEVAVTCRKCQAGAATKPAPAKREAPKVFGRLEWTITDLRHFAKEIGIAGRSKMTGDELLAEIVKTHPHLG